MDNRKQQIQKSICLNLFFKPLGMLISLIYTPLLLAYLGDEKYGIWVTILSIVNWVTYFDIGIGNGLRNRLAVEINASNYKEIKEYVSSAYRMLSLVVGGIFIICFILCSILNWKIIFNTKLNTYPVILISLSFLCVNFILSLQKTELFALQKSETVALLNILVSCSNLIGVTILFNIASNASLIALSIVFGLSNLMVNIISSVILWRKYPYLCPEFRIFEMDKVANICSLGIKFFLIQIAALVLFTTDNLIISRLFSPVAVTPYNTVYHAFGTIYSLFMAVLAPYWSRFTVAKEENDYSWMKKTLNGLKKLWALCSIVFLIIVPFFQPISDLWLGKHLNYDPMLIPLMAIYYISYIYSGIYSTALNGLGDINVQLICAIFSAVLNIPLSIFLAVNCGMATSGVCLGTIISLLIGDIAFTIQMHIIFRHGASNKDENGYLSRRSRH